MTRLCLVAVFLLAPRLAVADDAIDQAAAGVGAALELGKLVDPHPFDESHDVTTASHWLAVRVANETATGGVLGVAGLDAVYSERWDTTVQGIRTAFTFDASARAELGYSSGGAIASSTGQATFRGMLEPDAAEQVAPIEGVVSYALLRRPDLSDPRRAARDVSTSAGASVRFPVVEYRNHQNRHGALELRLGWSGTLQDGRALQEFDFDNRIYFYCRVRHGTPAPFCVDVIVWNTTGVIGGDEALIHTIYPVRLTGVPIGFGFQADAAAGGLTNTGSMTLSQNGQPIGTIMTADLPEIFVGAWDGRIHGTVGGAGVELRSRRSGWVSLDGDLTIEDRGTASISMRAGATSIALSGFVADTRWWTTHDDPGSAARTGGGELTVGRRIAGLDVVASAGAARTFYATLDGGAPADTRLGFRGGISISKPVWGQPAQ